MSAQRAICVGSSTSATQGISRSGLEGSLLELVRLRASQINGCAYCIDGHTAEALWLAATGREAIKLDRDTPDNQDKAGVRVATMHRVKGLEFDAVIIAGYRSPEHYADVYGAEEDAGVMLDNLTSERCLLHVAATRAKRYLMISGIE